MQWEIIFHDLVTLQRSCAQPYFVIGSLESCIVINHIVVIGGDELFLFTKRPIVYSSSPYKFLNLSLVAWYIFSHIDSTGYTPVSPGP